MSRLDIIGGLGLEALSALNPSIVTLFFMPVADLGSVKLRVPLLQVSVHPGFVESAPRNWAGKVTIVHPPCGVIRSRFSILFVILCRLARCLPKYVYSYLQIGQHTAFLGSVISNDKEEEEKKK